MSLDRLLQMQEALVDVEEQLAELDEELTVEQADIDAKALAKEECGRLKDLRKQLINTCVSVLTQQDEVHPYEKTRLELEKGKREATDKDETIYEKLVIAQERRIAMNEETQRILQRCEREKLLLQLGKDLKHLKRLLAQEMDVKKAEDWLIDGNAHQASLCDHLKHEREELENLCVKLPDFCVESPEDMRAASTSAQEWAHWKSLDDVKALQVRAAWIDRAENLEAREKNLDQLKPKLQDCGLEEEDRRGYVKSEDRTRARPDKHPLALFEEHRNTRRDQEAGSHATGGYSDNGTDGGNGTEGNSTEARSTGTAPLFAVSFVAIPAINFVVAT